MYNNQYEEYMRNSLGYNMPMMNMNQMDMNQMNMNTMQEMYESENNFSCNQVVDDMYPEIYKIIYPMVCKACMAVDENITAECLPPIIPRGQQQERTLAEKVREFEKKEIRKVVP